MRGYLAALGAALVLGTILIGWTLAVEAFGLAVWAPWAMDKRTEVVRNTNQYVETQQSKIYGLVRQYDELGAYEQTEEVERQRGNLVEQMCEAAGKIEPAYVPEQAQPLMREEGCWR